MKKEITIVGVGQRMSGTSKKTGKPYDFTEISFTYEDEQTEGVKACCSLVDQSILEGYEISPGWVHDVVMHYNMGKVVVDAFL